MKLSCRAAGVRGIVNAAAGVRNHFPSSFHYLKLELLDEASAELGAAWEEADEFIDSVLGDGGKVLIHCNAGYSRAPSIALGYVMRKWGRSLDVALATIRRSRPVRPNDGFMRQLRRLDDHLRPPITQLPEDSCN